MQESLPHPLGERTQPRGSAEERAWDLTLVRPCSSSDAHHEERLYSPQARAAPGVPDFPEKETVSGMGWAQSPLLCLQTCSPPSQIHPTAPLRRGRILQETGPWEGSLCCPSRLGLVPAPGG